MKHSQTITPIRTNRNKFNSNMPFRVIFSGTFNHNVYYDLSSAYLKLKIRCKPNSMKTMSATGTTSEYTGNFYMPTFNNTPVDFVQGFFSVYDDNGEELKFELNNINNECQADHCAMIEFIDKYPAEFEYNRHIRRLFAGHKGFETKRAISTMNGKYDSDVFDLLKTFDNKYKFIRGDDGYYYTTMYIPFTQILEPASRMSLLRIYAAEFDIFFKDTNKFWCTDLPSIEGKNGTYTSDHNIAGEPWITKEGTYKGLTYDNVNPLEGETPIDTVLYNVGHTFFNETPEIVDADLFMDQYTIESTEEIAKIGEKYFQPCVYQLDNHVLDFNNEIDINKFKLEVPFKPASCYYYFTQDNTNEHSLRTDYLYLNPPNHVVLKTLTGQSTPYPHYDNGDMDIQNTNNYVHKANSSSIAIYKSPDERFYNELLYNLKKFDHPIIDYESWKQIHRIYSIDMNSDLNMGSDKNTFFFEVGMETKPENNVRLHVIFVRDYS